VSAEGEVELSSVVDKTPGDCSLNLETGALTSGFQRDGRTVTGLGNPGTITGLSGQGSPRESPPRSVAGLGSPQTTITGLGSPHDGCAGLGNHQISPTWLGSPQDGPLGLGSPQDSSTGLGSPQESPTGLGSPQDGSRLNGKCGVDMQRVSTANGHCATGHTLPGKSRGTMSKDHVIGDTGTGGAGVEGETPTTTGCFACIALCHSRRRKSSK